MAARRSSKRSLMYFQNTRQHDVLTRRFLIACSASAASPQRLLQRLGPARRPWHWSQPSRRWLRSVVVVDRPGLEQLDESVPPPRTQASTSLVWELSIRPILWAGIALVGDPRTRVSLVTGRWPAISSAESHGSMPSPPLSQNPV